MTRIPLSRSKGQRSRSPGRFTHRRVGASGCCSGGRGNVLAVRNCCYVAVCSAARGFSAPTGGGGEGRGHIVAAARLQLVMCMFAYVIVVLPFYRSLNCLKVPVILIYCRTVGGSQIGKSAPHTPNQSTPTAPRHSCIQHSGLDPQTS